MFAEVRVLFAEAAAGTPQVLTCSSPREATNIRQRLYRVKNFIRTLPNDELNLIIDYIRFEIKNSTLTIVYRNPQDEILEKLNVKPESFS